MPPANTIPPESNTQPMHRKNALHSWPVLSALVVGVLMISVGGAVTWLETNELSSSPSITAAELAVSLPATPGIPPPPEFTVLHFGDAMFDRGVRMTIQGGAHPLDGMREKLSTIDADFVLLNLEGPVTDKAECQDKLYSFRFDPSIPAALRAAGIDAVTLANNHSLDCYRAGLEDTVRHVRAAEVIPFGGFDPASSVSIVSVKGRTIALVGMDATISSIPINAYADLITALSTTTDIILVSIHWGIEYETIESEAQRVIAHAFVDAGADAVFGHHPHVVQPVEIYRGAPIFYSLGNFIFDQTDPITKKGLGAEVIFTEGVASAIALHPYSIERNSPSFLAGDLKEAACTLITVSGIEREEGCVQKIYK